MQRIILSLIFLLLLTGCYTAQPIVKVDESVSFEKYEKIEVLPVINETGKTFQFDVAATLTQKIQEKLEERGYILADDPGSQKNILTIESSLISYEPGSAFKRWLGAPLIPVGKTQITVKTTLIDKDSGESVGDIVSAEVVSGGGLYSVGADKWILEVVAKGIAKEVEVRLNNK